MVVGIAAALLLTAGLLPPYPELWKRHGRVVGINFWFLTIDWLGAFFNLMGVAAQESFDLLGGCVFIICIVIEGGIFLSHGIWLFRTRKVRAAAKAAGRDFDELPESDVYHADVPRKGSIAAARDVEKNEIARRGSLAVARDLERGEKMAIPQLVKDAGSEESVVKPDIKVTCEEVRAGSIEGVQGIDYGTMEATQIAPKTRPGFKRQSTDTAFFKEPKW